MLPILKLNHENVCAEDSSTKSEKLMSASSCEPLSVNCDVIQVSPKVGAAVCSRNDIASSEVLSLQKNHSLKKHQMREHSNYLCDLFNVDGRYYIDSYLQDECIGPIKGLIDTGSQATIMSFNYFQQIVDRTEKKPKLKAFDGSLISVVNASNAHQYVENLRKHLQQAFAFAQKNLEKAAVSNKTYYDLKTTKKEYQVSDQVYLYNFARDQVKEKKFLPSWKGPYSIIDKLSPVVYKVKIPKGDEFVDKWVHINQLRACHPRSQLQRLERRPDEEE
ncbi:uncharacterized protein PAF06_016039 [Gastrophryne carolinensis]